MSVKYTIGDLVWATLRGQCPWPGRVSDPPTDLDLPKHNTDYHCIYFFGLKNYKWVRERNLKPYEEFQEEMMRYCTTEGFMDALNQIVDYIENAEKFTEFGHEVHIKDDIDEPKEEFKEEVDEPLEFDDDQGISKEESDCEAMDTSMVDEQAEKTSEVQCPMLARVLLPRLTIHECDVCAVCFLKRREFERHKQTHIEEIEAEQKSVETRKEYDNFNNNSYICDKNESDSDKRIITFTILDNVIRLKYRNGQLEVPTMLNPVVVLDRIEANKCKLCDQCFLDPHEYRIHEMSHLNSERSKIVHCEIVRNNKDTSQNYYESDKKVKQKLKSKLDNQILSDNKPKVRDSTKKDNISKTTELENFPPLKTALPKKRGRKKGTDEKETFPCSICKKTLSSRRNLLFHSAVHMKEKPYPCDICGKSYSHSSVLSIHRIKHTGIKQFTCQYCPKAFYYKAAKDLHERIHTGIKPFKCDNCDKAFSDPSAYKRHIAIHTGEKKYECNMCYKRYSERANLRRHIVLKHDRNKSFDCKICFKSFGFPCDLRQHVRFVHGEKKRKMEKYECDICGLVTVYKHSLEKHIKRMHENRVKGKPYSCDICSKQFKAKDYVALHMLDVHGTGKYICDYCGEVCKSKNKVKLHIDKHHTIEIFCHVCSKRFTRSSDLAEHKKKGCSKNVFKCDICDKEFVEKKSVGLHKRAVHLGIKLECHHCGAKYCSKSGLLNHLKKTHEKELLKHKVKNIEQNK